MTDSSQSIQELNDSNNTGVAAQPYNDQAAYTATVTPSATTVSPGTPVVLSGVATLTSDGDPAADVPVAVEIQVAGTTRTLTATTDASGNYSVTFQPLPNEAGEYSVTAADPGVTNPAVQAQFEIVGMTASPATANVTVVPDTLLSGTFTLTNLSATTLDRPDGDLERRPSGAGRRVVPAQPDRRRGDRDARLHPRRHRHAGILRRRGDRGHHRARGLAQHPAGRLGRAVHAGPGGQPRLPRFRHGRGRPDAGLVHGRQ